MKDIFGHLRKKLLTIPEAVIARAVEENPWFTPAEIRLAARNLAEAMLSEIALAELSVLYPALPVAPKNQKNILIIMAGNVPLVGVQDLVCVLASGHRAVVKLSSKDRALVEWLCADLVKENKFSILNSQFSINVDAVIAMGSSDTMRTLGERYASVPTLLRGSRWSLAVLSGAETEVELEGLADDVLTFSGLGCRNVSFVFVPRGYDFQPLRCVLKKRETNPKHQNNLRQTKALLQLTGTPFIDCGPVVMTEGRDFSTAVSRLNYAFYDTSNEAANWIERHKNEIQCVVGRDVAFGRSQRPTLFDYPDGRDTMDFLAKL